MSVTPKPRSLPKPVAPRFWAKVDKRGPDECWEWLGAKRVKEYGMITVNNQRKLAHRISLELAGVNVPDELMVLHSCDNPPCVNPAHLRLGTFEDNMRDRSERQPESYDNLRGTKQWKARLNPEKVRAIRVLRGQGLTHRRIAEMFGVSESTVNNVTLGRVWTHVA